MGLNQKTRPLCVPHNEIHTVWAPIPRGTTVPLVCGLERTGTASCRHTNQPVWHYAFPHGRARPWKREKELSKNLPSRGNRDPKPDYLNP